MVIARGPGLVAVAGDESGGDFDAAVWTSPDGVTWSRVPPDESVFGRARIQMMVSVTAGGPGLVAVGVDGSGDEDAAVWTSVDGLTWFRVPDDESVLGGVRSQMMLSVIDREQGLVGVGRDDADGDRDAAVWVERPQD